MVKKGKSVSSQIQRGKVDDLERAMAELVAQGKTAKQVSEELGVHVRVVFRRLQTPEWMTLVKEIQDELVVKPVELRLRGVIPSVVELFIDTMNDQTKSISTRLHAAQWLWEKAGVRFADDKGLLSDYAFAVIGTDGVARVLLPGGRTRIAKPPEEITEGEFRAVDDTERGTSK